MSGKFSSFDSYGEVVDDDDDDGDECADDDDDEDGAAGLALLDWNATKDKELFGDCDV